MKQALNKEGAKQQTFTQIVKKWKYELEAASKQTIRLCRKRKLTHTQMEAIRDVAIFLIFGKIRDEKRIVTTA